MKLTPEQLAAFRAHLAHVGGWSCPVCVGQGSAPYWHYGLVAVHCLTCGHVTQFSAAVVGVTPDPATYRAGENALALYTSAPVFATEQTLTEIRDLLRQLADGSNFRSGT